MKRILPLVLCLLLLAGCGSKAPEAEPQTQAPAVTQAPETQPTTVPPTTEPPPPPFHPLDLETQSQLHRWGACCIQEGRYYGNFYENHYHRFGYTDDGGKTWTRLNRSPVNHVSIQDGQLYYSLNGDQGGIYRAALDGSGPELLMARPGARVTEPVQYFDGYFYCQDPHNHWTYIRVSKDGGEPETVIDKEVWYPVIHDGWVLYQDDEDTMSLHWFCLETGEDYKLNDTYSFTPFFDGEHIYYILCDTFDETREDNAFMVHRMDPDGQNDIELSQLPVDDMMTDGRHIYFTTWGDHLLFRMNMDGSEPALFLDPTQLPEGHPIEIIRMEYGHIILHINMGRYNLGNYVVSMEDGSFLGRF